MMRLVITLSERVQVGEHVEVMGEWSAWGRHGSSAELLPYLGPVYLFHLTVPELYPFTINL